MIRRWTPRHTETFGFLLLIAGLATWDYRAALVVAGVVLILAAYVRASNG